MMFPFKSHYRISVILCNRVIKNTGTVCLLYINLRRMKPLKRNYSEPELEFIRLSFPEVLESSNMSSDENKTPFEPEE